MFEQLPTVSPEIRAKLSLEIAAHSSFAKDEVYKMIDANPEIGDFIVMFATTVKTSEAREAVLLAGTVVYRLLQMQLEHDATTRSRRN